MNCQDIARIVDRERFSALDATDLQDAEAHASQCRHCAPLWFTHARLAASPVPPMSAELEARCLASLAANGQTTTSRRAPRRIIVVTSLVALAAAASMVGLGLSRQKATPHDRSPAIPTLAPASASTGLQENAASGVEQALRAATRELPAPDARHDIPVFPQPYAAERAFADRVEKGRKLFLELHPEVTQALPAETLYAGTIVFRADGMVVDHSIRTLEREALHWSRNDPSRGIPNDGGEAFGDYLPKGMQLADGRTLGADLSLRNVRVSNTYDPARSSLRVDEIVRAQRAALMLPSTASGSSHLAVLLSGAGTIQREVAGYLATDALQEQEGWSATRRAEAMAGVLGVGKDQIGLMGSVSVYDMDTKRGVFVDYAWQRLPGESAPAYRQSGSGNTMDEGFDQATALALVERVMPDAFMGEELERALGIPTILLTEEGEFIRTARIRASNPADEFPGTSFATFRLQVLTNPKGAKSAVYFMWQGTPPKGPPSKE